MRNHTRSYSLRASTTPGARERPGHWQRLLLMISLSTGSNLLVSWASTFIIITIPCPPRTYQHLPFTRERPAEKTGSSPLPLRRAVLPTAYLAATETCEVNQPVLALCRGPSAAALLAWRLGCLGRKDPGGREAQVEGGADASHLLSELKALLTAASTNRHRAVAPGALSPQPDRQEAGSCPRGSLGQMLKK